MTNLWEKYIEPMVEDVRDMIDDALDEFDDLFDPESPAIVIPRPEPKTPYIRHDSDLLGDLYRKIEVPDIEEHQDEFIPQPPRIIEPLPGQIREGGKLRDLFDPESPPFPPIIIPRSEPKISPPPYIPPPDVPVYDLGPGEAFAQTSPFGGQNRPFQPFQC